MLKVARPSPSRPRRPWTRPPTSPKPRQLCPGLGPLYRAQDSPYPCHTARRNAGAAQTQVKPR
uniref:Uncharacterized protein n=1 Tax=uncultured alpha proteobacterium HF0010_30A23 TaxID=710802 RepID=E0XRL6_9PROT|nr:hypothetical protein [uncultured alpha proteobacterium HF0010_30A23]